MASSEETMVQKVVGEQYAKKAPAVRKPRKPKKGDKRRQRASITERLDNMENAFREMYTQFVHSASAINRAEEYLFSLVKLLKDAGVLDLQALAACMDELPKHKYLDQYWDCVIGEGDDSMEETMDDVAQQHTCSEGGCETCACGEDVMEEIEEGSSEGAA